MGLDGFTDLEIAIEKDADQEPWIYGMDLELVDGWIVFRVSLTPAGVITGRARDIRLIQPPGTGTLRFSAQS